MVDLFMCIIGGLPHKVTRRLPKRQGVAFECSLVYVCKIFFNFDAYITVKFIF